MKNLCKNMIQIINKNNKLRNLCQIFLNLSINFNNKYKIYKKYKAAVKKVKERIKKKKIFK